MIKESISRLDIGVSFYKPSCSILQVIQLEIKDKYRG